jgi:hypothetical protein
MELTTANVLTIISLILGSGVAILQLYVSARLSNIREEVIEQMRKELNLAITEMESVMATTKDLENFRNNISLMLENLRLEIKLGNKNDARRTT